MLYLLKHKVNVNTVLRLGVWKHYQTAQLARVVIISITLCRE